MVLVRLPACMHSIRLHENVCMPILYRPYMFIFCVSPYWTTFKNILKKIFKKSDTGVYF